MTDQKKIDFVSWALLLSSIYVLSVPVQQEKSSLSSDVTNQGACG